MDAYCKTEEDTIAFAKKFGRTLPKNSVVCFFGDLGSGKTTFIKGLVEGASDYSSHAVSSPTFTYLNIYTSSKSSIYHFDLYRLRDIDEFLSMGFDDYFTAGGICCVEWSERIKDLLPSGCLFVTMSLADNGGRKIEIKTNERKDL